jgi:uncharacterized protein DUF3800
MADVYVFADEAGNFDFSLQPGASRYFILATVTAPDCKFGDRLLELRRELGWRGRHLDRVFHAAEDSQAVRDEVFDLLVNAHLRVDATILEKRKAQPHLQSGQELYKMAWHLHFKRLAQDIATKEDRLFVVASRLGTKRKRGSFHTAIDDVVHQVAPCRAYRVAFWPAESDPCLQVADYCTWAIQRKWERGDSRSYDLIKDEIASEFDAWERGDELYY